MPFLINLPKNILVFFIIIFAILHLSNAYLQFKIYRLPHQSSKEYKKQHKQFKCPQSISKIAEADYKEPCYDKDISYSFQLYKDDQVYLIGADFSTPISWIKGKDCLLQGVQNKKCSFISSNAKATIKDYASVIRNKLKKHNDDDKEDDRQKAKIQGSSNIVEGYLQKPPHLAFQIMDSNRLTRLVDILLLGFYILGEKDALQLQSTKFINATSLTPKLSYISDGAISLRFDQNSQNSFLNQIFDYTKAEQKIATLYLGENSYLALGELSLKFSEHGYSGISWIKVQQDENFGKVPTVSQILIQDNERQISKRISINKPAILTLSASYIGIHSDMIQKLQSKLAKSSTCQFQQHGYLKCTYNRKSDKDKDLHKRLTFSFGQSSISLDLSELVIHSDSKSFVLNLKQVFQQDYLILGEPIFKKYTLYLDYGKEKVGFAIKRQHFQAPFINVVSLIRFLVFVFTCGCCFILCSAPCRVICNHLWSKKLNPRALGKQGIRLKQYSPIQQNPYDQISQKVKQITSKQTTQIQGHPEDQI